MRTSLPAWGVAFLLSAAAVGMTAVAHAAVAKYDGLWSVLVVTESGECDRAYRYSLRINRGTLKYEGDPGGIDVAVSGRVDDGGRVNVSVGRGQHSASGTGRLSTDHGAGTWRGKSPTAACSGRWEAERRG
jgi:hypothetical protein